MWMPFCFTALGGTAEINGKIYNGAANIFYAQMANATTITELHSSLRFATFGFVKIFGSVAVALAIIYCAKKERKEEVKGMILPSAFVATLSGITEPLDFLFLFASPLLWFVHSILTAISETILWAIGARTYMLFGLIDSVVSNLPFSPSITKFYLVIIVGLIMGVVWFLVFVYLIKKFNLQTPGREEIQSDEVRVSDNKDDFQQRDIELTISGLGGKENIETITNCFTRLRITVKNLENVNKDILKQISNQKGIVENGKNIQIIIGLKVQSFKEALCEFIDWKE